MPNEKILQFKPELKKMKKENLLEMVLNQKKKYCLLDGVCPFLCRMPGAGQEPFQWQILDRL
jgi:hypothetical protein